MEILEGTIFECHSDDDEEHDDEGEEEKPRKGRGANLTWTYVKRYETMSLALEEHTPELLKESNLLKGRINRGTTVSRYYECCFKSCGCPKVYKLQSSTVSTRVTLYEALSHENHDNDKRNGGYGLSYAQYEMLEQAIKLKIKKPKGIIQYFEDMANESKMFGYHECLIIIYIITYK